MPTSKSWTSSDESQLELYREKAAEGDYLFLLKELLAVCHRDGGQYTELVGIHYSVVDAEIRLSEERVELRELKHKRRTKT